MLRVLLRSRAQALAEVQERTKRLRERNLELASQVKSTEKSALESVQSHLHRYGRLVSPRLSSHPTTKSPSKHIIHPPPLSPLPISPTPATSFRGAARSLQTHAEVEVKALAQQKERFDRLAQRQLAVREQELAERRRQVALQQKKLEDLVVYCERQQFANAERIAELQAELGRRRQQHAAELARMQQALADQGKHHWRATQAQAEALHQRVTMRAAGAVGSGTRGESLENTRLRAEVAKQQALRQAAEARIAALEQEKR